MSDPNTIPFSDSDPDAPGPGVATEAPAGGLQDAIRQRDDYLEQLRRSQADLVNYRKRVQAQAESDKQYAVSGIARDLLAVLDNFDRALDAARASGTADIVKGLELVHRQFLEALAKHGVEPIVAVGQAFDPNQHEAMVQQPSADHPEGTVLAEYGRGYRLGERVIRPSKVSVSARP